MGRTRKKAMAANLGRSLINAKNKQVVQQQNTDIHSTDSNERESDRQNRLTSILEQNDLQSFMEMAQATGRDFSAERENVRLIVNEVQSETSKLALYVKQYPKATKETFMQALRTVLPVPRRPPWNFFMKREELREQEKQSFLEWRRNLAKIENDDKMVITPFEKNLEVWRQLWRVLERSDLVVQIVDARNPLQFRNADIEKYVSELGLQKRSVLLLNKAELLTHTQRRKWAAYLRANGISFLWFSAFLSQQEINQSQAEEIDSKPGPEETPATHLNVDKEEEKGVDDTHIYNHIELLSYFESLLPQLGKKGQQHDSDDHHEDQLSDNDDNDEEVGQSQTNQKQSRRQVTIGMVGYPNVGKSSTINALCGIRRVATSATPGKTKHFQTIPISDDVLLCDCPGLVFPSVTFSKESMICDGILSIDHMRGNYREAVALVVARVPRGVFELLYGLRFDQRPGDVPDRQPGVEELLRAYASSRSWMTQTSGQPDEGRAARTILKDYVNGKLLYCHPPPQFLLSDGSELPIDEDVAPEEDTEVDTADDGEDDDDDDDYITEEEDDDELPNSNPLHDADIDTADGSNNPPLHDKFNDPEENPYLLQVMLHKMELQQTRNRKKNRRGQHQMEDDELDPEQRQEVRQEQKARRAAEKAKKRADRPMTKKEHIRLTREGHLSAASMGPTYLPLPKAELAHQVRQGKISLSELGLVRPTSQ